MVGLGRFPTKTELKYKVRWDGSIILKVAASAGLNYVWQYCPAGSATWRDFGSVESCEIATEPGAAYVYGDKYRCICYRGIKTVRYSSVLTISAHTAQRAREEAARGSSRASGSWDSYGSSGYSQGQSSYGYSQPKAEITDGYFKDCKTVKDAEVLYRQLMMKHHPDRGGDEETAKIINEQYDTFRQLHAGEEDGYGRKK